MNRFARHFQWLSIIGLAIGGCQQYTPRPLDPAAHRAEWLARDAASGTVADAALRLGAAAADDGPFDIRDGVSCREAEAIALVFNPDLRLARARARVSATDAANAGRWEDPQLGLDITRIVSSAADPWKLMGSIGVTLPVSGRLKAERARAGAASEADLARVVEAEWNVRVEVRRRWAAWSAERERVDVLTESVGSLRELVGTVGRIEEAGELSGIETRLFRLELLDQEIRLARIGGGVAAGEVALRRLLGLARETAPTLTPALPRSREVNARVLNGNPSYLVTLAEYEEAERQLALEIRRQYPDLMTAPGAGRDEGMDEISLGLSLPIPAWNRNQQGVARATAQREAARVAHEGVIERLAWEHEAALVARRTAVAQRAAIESGLVPMADKQYADARRLSELGEVNTLLILESLSRYAATRLALIDAALEERLADIAVEAVVGPEVAP